MSTSASLGTQIKTLRIEANLTQEELSKLCGVERSQLSRIESDEVIGVTFATVIKILNSLNKTLTVSDIVDINNKSLNVHPFVKWAGGKSQLLETILKHTPKQFNRYFEPFLGGGALLFKLQPDSFSINDMNSELINAYKCFTNDALYKELISLLKTYEKKHSEEFYYQIRDLDKDPLFEALPPYERAARMIYLNKACFNGLYRVNSKGYFNVPSGKKKSVKCFDEANFENLRLLFKKKKYVITNTDFEEATKNAKEGDFVYFDPPYDSFENQNNFTSYSKVDFGKEEQARLAKTFKKLSDRGVYVLLSNHNTKYIRELYKDFHINVINAKRMINSKGDGRGDVEEVLISNYE